jgi:hypothetical protein
MNHLRERLIAGGGGRDFSGVAGCLLSVWFGEKLDELPPKRWDDSIIEPLLDAVADCKVDHAAIARLTQEIAERGFPQVLPPVIETGKTPDESAGFVANAVLGPTEGVRFSTGLGFEVQTALAGAGDVRQRAGRPRSDRQSARPAADRAPPADRRRATAPACVFRVRRRLLGSSRSSRRYTSRSSISGV